LGVVARAGEGIEARAPPSSDSTARTIGPAILTLVIGRALSKGMVQVYPPKAGA
jgi:hypothetical protein